MLVKQLLGRLLTTCRNVSQKRLASTSTSTSLFQNTERVMFDKAAFNYSPLKETTSTASVLDHISRLRPFNPPAAPQPTMTTPLVVEELELTSVLRKRRLKMNKHKHKKLMKRTRALRKKLGK